MSMTCRPKRLFLLRHGSCDTRHIDFPRVDGLSTDTPDLGHHRKSRKIGGMEDVRGEVVANR